MLFWWTQFLVVESHGGVESEKLKHQFSHVKGDLDLQEILNLPVPIPNLKTLWKKTIVVKEKDEKCKIARKILHCV
jgi:hypothetical protein